MRQRRSRARRSRFWIGSLALLVVAVALLAGTAGLSRLVLSQSQSLEKNVRLTQSMIDANFRTLGQTQRELLRLEVLLVGGAPRSAVLLQADFVSQRAQESSLNYQLKTLGEQELLDRARDLAQRWLDDVRPRVTALPLVPGTRLVEPVSPGSPVMTSVQDLELGYNQLVSDGEINRKVAAGQANQRTVGLLRSARSLTTNLLLTLGGFVVFLLIAGLTYARFHRHREVAAARLLALNTELRTLSQVASSTDNVVIITDARGRVEWVNDAFERITGYDLAFVRGRSPGALLQGPDTDPATVAELRERISAAAPYTGEILNYRRDGTPYWISLDVQPVFGDDGAVTHFIAVEADVTERRLTEDHLRRAKEAAEETAQEKANFLASMSHEIRTPLNAVLGLTDLLLETDLNGEQRDFVLTAQSSGHMLLAVINDILNFSALESGRVEFECRDFDVRRLVDGCVRMMLPEAHRRSLELTWEVDATVPVWLRGDDNRLRQVLTNLLSNALKFTETGTVSATVRSLGRQPEGRWRVEIGVRDTGIGIEADRIAKLFMPFTQGDASTTRRYGGTGLGLAICRLIGEHMGGRFDVSSVVGEGSTFTLVVDLPEGQPVDGVAADTVRTGATPLDSRLRVLLVEDDAVNRKVALHMLGRLGISADSVTDGAAALKACEAIPYELVLMDIHMPHMDGVTATQELRRRGGEHRPWIVAMTASALAGDRERFLAAGMDDYISKPVQLAALRELLTHAPAATKCLLEPVDSGEQVQPIDKNLLVDRLGFDDDDMIREVVHLLIGDAALRLAEAAAAVAVGDRAGAMEQAHALKGASASAGADRMSRMCAALETSLRNRDRAGTDALLRDLDAELSDLRNWATRHLGAGAVIRQAADLGAVSG